MRTVPVSVQGLRVKVPRGLIDQELTARQKVRRQSGGRGKGLPQEDTVNVPIYRADDGLRNSIVGLGAILFLAKRHPFLDIDYTHFDPPRQPMRPFVIPEGVSSAPKFRVNGRERWYFYEALEACRKAHCGCVKLPTGAGKTAIELTLAYNQSQQIGVGIMVVPNHTIKDQFIKAGKIFGIPLKDYRDWLDEPHRELDQSILITTPMVLKNDIDEIGEWVKGTTKRDMRPVLHKHQQIHWVIADECHHGGCDTWLSIFMGLTELTRSHGFSALPVEEATEGAISFLMLPWEDAVTISIVGPIIYQKSTYELRDFLNIPTLINLSYQWPIEHSEIIYDTWPPLRAAVQLEDKRTRLISDVVNWFVSQKRIVIVHVLERDFAYSIVDACGSDAVVSWLGGSEIMTVYKRDGVYQPEDRHLAEFDKVQRVYDEATFREQCGKTIFGLVCTSHAIEGLDLDDPINVTVMCEGQKVRSTIQKAGRAVRPGERGSLIINISDKGIGVLPRHASSRADAVLKEFGSRVYEANSLDSLKRTVTQIERLESLDQDA